MSAGGPGVVNLGINASGFLNQINTLINSTTNYNTVVNNLNVQLNQIHGASTGAAGGLGSLNRQLNALTAIASAQSVASLARQLESATREAAEFSRSIGLIQTITADANMSYQQWAEGIKAVSDALGTPLVETSAAAYDLLSNQVAKGADAFQTLTVAGNLANITGSRVTDAINALSSAINAYGYASADTEAIAAKMFATVDLGRVKLNEIANTAGRVYEEAKALGVSFEEVNAGLVAITQTGVKANTAMTLMNGLFNGLLKPTKDLQALYEELGTSSADVAVKTFGLTEVLGRIRDKTNGSTAAVAKYLNELRSRQAYDILTDRAEAFRDALAEQDKALERSKAALEAYQSTPGFRLQRESQQLHNEFVTGLKTGILEDVVAVTETLGGMRNALREIIPLAGSAGAGMAGFATALGASEIAAVGLGGALAGISWPAVGVGVTTAALASLALRLQQDREEAEHLYEALAAHHGDLARRAAADDAKMRAEDVADSKAALATKQRDILEFAAAARRNLATIGETLDEAGSKLTSRLKNDVELVLGSAKDSLRELESRFQRSISNVSAARQSRRDVAAGREDAIFGYQLAADRVATGGENEGRILQSRLDQLNAAMAKASKAGDLQAFDAAFGKAETLVNQAATATDEAGNLKYHGQLAAINDLYSSQLRYLKEIEAVNSRNADALTRQKASLSSQVKAAEDAGKALAALAVADRQGNPLFGSRQAFEDRASGLMGEFNRALDAIRANPHAGIGDRVGLLQTQALMEKRIADLRADYGALVSNRGARQGTLDQGARLEGAIGSLSKVMASAAEKIAAAVADANRLGLQSGTAHANLRAALGAILGERNLIQGTETEEFKSRREKLVAETVSAADHGDFDAAHRALGSLDAWLRATDNYRKPVMTSGLRDSQGNLINRTPQEAISSARTALYSVQEIDRGANAAASRSALLTSHAPDTFADAVNRLSEISPQRVETATAALDTLISRIGESLSRIEGLSTGAGEAAASKSQGGFAGYFAAGGEPRGIDSVLVRMSPDEMIMSPQASARFKSQLQAMNAGFGPPSAGATINHGDIHVGDIHIGGGPTAKATADEFVATLRRGIRSGRYRLQ